MGRIEVFDKLAGVMETYSGEECQVVYIMSRIRKVLEMNKEKEKYKFLNFYSNWTLHSKLDKKNTTRLLSDLLDKDVDLESQPLEISRLILANGVNFFKLSTLREELEEFIQNQDLPSRFMEKNWILFQKILLETIKESPIIFDSRILQNMELIKDPNGHYCYKFSLIGTKQKPVIKLKFK